MAQAQEVDPGTLYIQGEGTLTVSYDRIKLQVQINCKSEGINTASLAQNQNHETTNAFMVALEDELGITKDKNLKMDNLRLHPIREYNNEKKKSLVTGYSATVSLNIDVSTEDKKLVSQIYALASRFEAESTEVNVHGANPYVSDKKKKENFVKLFENTMEDAYFKAELYAKGCKRTLGPVMVMSDNPISVQNINPQPRGGAQPRMMMAKSRGGAEAYAADAVEMEMPLGEGQKLTKRVHLQFQLL
ncbi:hypothetical protein HOP50_01g08100 [Chloropicon primus]|uniref:DUF541 domain-containing protein n=1 Tax=Chloropicon primus TaxID=1764295 RepID=A0A5B8MDQ8_9CHLO|nr:hypothetical protein A3770_01p08220 [Chloropicon primus]UPQ97515.1 hypothetical protein HOP50_01g08100 [Chloropicon primus]|eukprot:QDZ18304.1 hypothetical protein A3770_01p08220 [Chloropicon primus]